MTKAGAKEILVACFRNLSRTQRANLAWHERHKTPIACGREAGFWILPSGAG